MGFNPLFRSIGASGEYSLSLEEETAVFSDLDEGRSGITDDISSVSRLNDISDTLEDVADISGEIRQASPIELALIKCTANMAVAGTDINSEKVIKVSDAALESMMGSRIAIEDIKSAAVNIWRKIIDFASRIWESVKRFWKTYFGVGKSVESKTKKLNEQVRDTHGKKAANEKIIVPAALNCRGSFIKDGGDLIRQLKTFKEVMENVYEKHLRSVSSLSNKVVKILESTTLDNVLDKANDLLKIYSTGNEFCYLASVYKEKAKNINYGDKYIATQTPDLLGGGVIITKLLNLDKSPDLSVLDDIGKCGSRLSTSDFNLHAAVKESIEAKILSPTEMEAVLELLASMGNILTATHKLIDGELNNINSQMKRACEKLSDIWSNEYVKLSLDAEAGMKHKLTVLKNMGKTYVSFSTLAYDPAIPLEHLFRRVSNGALDFVNKSKNQYH